MRLDQPFETPQRRPRSADRACPEARGRLRLVRPDQDLRVEGDIAAFGTYADAVDCEDQVGRRSIEIGDLAHHWTTIHGTVSGCVEQTEASSYDLSRRDTLHGAATFGHRPDDAAPSWRHNSHWLRIPRSAVEDPPSMTLDGMYNGPAANLNTAMMGVDLLATSPKYPSCSDDVSQLHGLSNEASKCFSLSHTTTSTATGTLALLQRNHHLPGTGLPPSAVQTSVFKTLLSPVIFLEG